MSSSPSRPVLFGPLPAPYPFPTCPLPIPFLSLTRPLPIPYPTPTHPLPVLYFYTIELDPIEIRLVVFYSLYLLSVSFHRAPFPFIQDNAMMSCFVSKADIVLKGSMLFVGQAADVFFLTTV